MAVAIDYAFPVQGSKRHTKLFNWSIAVQEGAGKCDEFLVQIENRKKDSGLWPVFFAFSWGILISCEGNSYILWTYFKKPILNLSKKITSDYLFPSHE